MSMIIRNAQVRRESGDLVSEEWHFCVVGEQVVLDRYTYLERASKRHKYRAVRWYERINARDSTVKLDEVPFPDDVTEEALAEVRSRFYVVKELRR